MLEAKLRVTRRPPAKLRPFVLDDVNRAILDGMAHADPLDMLAQRASCAPAMVHNRVAAMERSGIITGYVARIDWERLGLPLTVMVAASCPPGAYAVVAARLAAMPQVVDAALSTGRLNLEILLRARDMGDVRRLMVAIGQPPVTNVDTRIRLTGLHERASVAALEPAADASAPPASPVP